jgi:hypothetical protein
MQIIKVKNFFGSSTTPEAAAERPVPRTERTMLLDRLADSTDGVKLERTTGELLTHALLLLYCTQLTYDSAIDLLAYPGCILEVTQNGCVETLWIV